MNRQLNLARKWRPKKLDEIIGQDLVINLIKNSLYRNLISPVYSFSGPKGSGKTSTARLFASSLNCAELKGFVEKPKSILLPCLQCVSCNAMSKSAHPDFIEIDAASNTGVENIRHIIETASFSPVLSAKKIYLIDEAHMLSKSAFNAFLKILEDPPKNTIFMLVTTDILKIVATVRSRCLQLFFDPIKQTQIAGNLEYICEQENINCDKDALNLIADYADGSLRDALNILEKLRLSNTDINKNSVLENLGFISCEKLFELLNIILDQDLDKLTNFFSIINFKNYNALNIWKNFLDLIYKIFLIKNNVNVDINIDINLINNISNKISSDKLINMLEICNSYEFNISKSSMPHLNLELMFIKLTRNQGPINSGFNNTSKDTKPNINKLDNKPDSKPDINKLQVNKSDVNIKLKDNNINNKLDNKLTELLKEINNLNDPLLSSIFNQAQINLDKLTSKMINLIFLKDFVFFKDLLEDTKALWNPIFNKFFGSDIVINFQFDDAKENSALHNNNINNNNIVIRKKETNLSGNSIINNKIDIDISDQSKWPRANNILKIFPGRINWE